ncbi:thiolase [Streptosporangium sp. NPDC051022]|uniref:thiolase C-terminal domain-containing protein n=1 Tax=Streptosporangium sp. NPDC051022 TaxID=3155752 RepID=UPI0034292EF7
MKAPRTAIVGVHEHPRRVEPDLSAWQIKAACAAEALADAGLTWSDVDAVYDASETGPGAGLAIAEYLGITPSVVDTTSVGGSSYQAHVAHARDAIRAGRARVALLTYGSTARSKATGGAAFQWNYGPVAEQETPYGLTLIGSYALAARRHMHEYGTTPEQLAEIAVIAREHALRNPDAVAGLEAMRIPAVPLTVDAVLGSKPIADPLRLLDCCLVNDGGGAVVLAAEDVVPDTRKAPVWVLGAAESAKSVDFGSDITSSAAVESGAAAFGQAGVKPSDIDIAMIYDSFTITTLMILEDLGFCAKGEGGPFVQGAGLRAGDAGRLSLNTDGGGLSSSHPGMRGLFLLIEAARQLRGESTAQVDGARLAVAHGNGGQLGTRHNAGTVILGRDRP